jgi:hypothetical protein
MSYHHPKLAEASFFIELFQATQERTESLTRGADLATEASFLFSAILNSFYSAVDQWRMSDRTKNEAPYKAFVERHPEIYSHSHFGGWRSTTVHVKHIPISYAGYIPPKGREVDLVFSMPPKLASNEVVEDRVDLRFLPYYYVEYKGEMKEVVAFSNAHLEQLAALIESQISDEPDA